MEAIDLLNNRMAYVAVSRGAYDAQIFTNDREKLGAARGHDVSHSSAHALEMKPEQKQERAVTPQREIAPEQEQSLGIGLGLYKEQAAAACGPGSPPASELFWSKFGDRTSDLKTFF